MKKTYPFFLWCRKAYSTFLTTENNLKKSSPKIIFLLIFIVYIAGCGYLSKSRRAIYIKNHPELSMEQKDLLLNGKLWVGMTPKEARASLGSPYIIQKDILGEKEVWSYMYKDISTTHIDYKFNRVLRLEFIEGRLANWRED